MSDSTVYTNVSYVTMLLTENTRGRETFLSVTKANRVGTEEEMKERKIHFLQQEKCVQGGRIGIGAQRGKVRKMSREESIALSNNGWKERKCLPVK